VLPPSDVCFCVYKSGNHNTMDQGTLKELNKRSSQQEGKKDKKKEATYLDRNGTQSQKNKNKIE